MSKNTAYTKTMKEARAAANLVERSAALAARLSFATAPRMAKAIGGRSLARA